MMRATLRNRPERRDERRGAVHAMAAPIKARVIACYSVRPVDAVTLDAAAAATSGRLVIVEDHRPEGGLGSGVVDALLAGGGRRLSLARLTVREMPGSGSSEELLAWAGIDSERIASAARGLLRSAPS
jgi:transketolase